jgi:hypothetical protein
MELSPEDKRRIEEEERRAAEERYRAEVRVKLRPPSQRSSLLLILGAAILIVIIVGAIVWSRSKTSAIKSTAKSDDSSAAQQAAKPSPLRSSPPVPKTRYVPVDQKIVTGEITLKARGYLQYRVTVTPEMLEPTLTGNFTATGGANDIMAVIADETNYTNWINGHQARSFWSTQGRETTGSFEVHLSPGMYYLAFSNRFSRLTNKQVFIQADLSYKKAETYYDDQGGQPSACFVPPCTGVIPSRVRLPDTP